jgi:hypothetical protein
MILQERMGNLLLRGFRWLVACFNQFERILGFASLAAIGEAIMAGKEIAVKKYVVRLSSEERQRLETLIRKGKGPSRRLLKARLLGLRAT